MPVARERTGFGAAVLLAGPVFVLTAGLAAGWWDRVTPANAISFVGLALFSVPFGAILSFLPIWLGAKAMTVLGRHNVALRLPVMWLLAGAGGGALIGWAFDPALTGGAASFMAVVGAACAGLSRRFTRWDDCANGPSHVP